MAVTYKDSASAAATSVTLPAHEIGDLILIFAWRSVSNTPPSQPSASGTVPTWTTISANTGSGSTSMRVAYTVTTAKNTTSGTWTNAQMVTAVVLSAQAISPIGGNAEAGIAAGTSWTAPAITLSDTSGNSMILHLVNGGSTQTFSAAPSGYTAQFSYSTTSGSVRVLTKNVTTTDGSVTQTVNTSNSGRAASIEILSPKPNFFAFF